MSTPIDFGDIQVRDTVTRDLAGITSTLTVAKRHASSLYTDSSSCLANSPNSTWRLLHRPKPAVVLPSGPQLGWATVHPPNWDKPVTVLSRFMLDGDRLISAAPLYSVNDVTAFVAATAVPTEALLHLRCQRGSDGQDATTTRARVEFFTAVDAANGTPK